MIFGGKVDLILNFSKKNFFFAILQKFREQFAMRRRGSKLKKWAKNGKIELRAECARAIQIFLSVFRDLFGVLIGCKYHFHRYKNGGDILTQNLVLKITFFLQPKMA